MVRGLNRDIVEAQVSRFGPGRQLVGFPKVRRCASRVWGSQAFTKRRTFALVLALIVGALPIGLVNSPALAAASQLLVANAACSTTTSYRATANGDVSVTTGRGVCDPRSVAFDSANIYIANFAEDSVLVYRRTVRGDREADRGFGQAGILMHPLSKGGL